MANPAATRRWPPAVAGISAVVLAMFVLPNPFKIPQNNPTASAEYAPVPGKADASGNANFGETNIADSSGIGSGNDGEGLGAGTPPPPPPPQFKARQKNCVGNPARQTEDPLSPPCVPLFEGDNGGSTFQGVDKDSIKIVLYNDLDVDGDMNKPWKSSDEHTCPPYTWDCKYLIRTVKALLRYYTARYQTYGRTVEMLGVKSAAGTATCASRRNDAQSTRDTHKPFAVVTFGEGAMHCYQEEMAKVGVPSFGVNYDVPRRNYEKYSPYVFGFFPDIETQAAWSAGFICRKLNGYKAQYAGDAELRALPRKFGLVMPNGIGRGPEMAYNAENLQAGLKKQCGLEPGPNLVLKKYDYKENEGAGGKEAPTIMQAFKQENVTTVVCYCIPVPTEETVASMQSAASGLNYHPEWYWDHASAMDRPVWLQTHHSREERHRSFGVSYFWRNAALREQPHYKAYLEQEGGSQPNVRWSFTIYTLYLNLFQGDPSCGAGPEPAIRRARDVHVQLPGPKQPLDADGRLWGLQQQGDRPLHIRRHGDGLVVGSQRDAAGRQARRGLHPSHPRWPSLLLERVAQG